MKKPGRPNCDWTLPESALVKHDDITPIVPGHSRTNDLWRRITTDDESEMMRRRSHRALKPEQKELLKHWIEQGAPYAEALVVYLARESEIPEVSTRSAAQRDRYFIAAA